MTDREKLIELMTDLYGGDPLHYGVKAHHIADHLISNGVTFAKDTDVPSKWISSVSSSTSRHPGTPMPRMSMMFSSLKKSDMGSHSIRRFF